MKKRGIVQFALAVMFVLGVVGTAQASPSGNEIFWWTVDGGGGTSTGGDYTVSGTIGQPDAGEMSGGDYAVSGGFWVRMAIRYIFLPLVLREAGG